MMGPPLRTTRSLLLLAGLSLVAATASPDTRAAHGRFEQATDLYRRGDFAAAAAGFEQAFDQGGPPVCLYNAADAAERAGQPARAEGLWRRYLRLCEGAEREAAQARLTALTTRSSTVVLHSQPPGAEILIDGAASGRRTPARLSLGPGQHRLRMELPRHEPADRVLELAYGQPVTLEVSLHPLPTTAHLRISTVPEAEVLLDGALVGRTPFDREVAAGRHELELRAPGRTPRRSRLQLEALERASVHVILESRVRRVRLGALGGVALSPRVEGLGTGARVELMARLEPWDLPLGLGLDLGFSPLQGGVISTVIPCLSVRLTPARLLAGRLALRVEAGVGYAWLHLGGSPEFTSGQSGDLSALAIGGRLLVTVSLTRRFELLVAPIAFETLPGRFDLPSSLTRLHLGVGLAGSFGL